MDVNFSVDYLGNQHFYFALHSRARCQLQWLSREICVGDM